MTEKKLDKITIAVRNAVINYLDMDKSDLLDLVVSLHNELCKEVDGEYCDYAYHWANIGYGGCPNDSLFKEAYNGTGNNLVSNDDTVEPEDKEKQPNNQI